MNQKSYLSKFLKSFLFAVGLVAVVIVKGFAAQSVKITPPEFDFGWCPDNAKVTAQFSVANTTEKLVPLIAVMPTCGCTAADFTPADIPSAKNAQIALTFNTRGYTGVKFHKSSQVKAGQPEEEYSVVLTGIVADPSAVVLPEGTGIVEFSTGSAKEAKSIVLLNKSGKDLSLKLVQAPASWVSVSLESASIEAGKNGGLQAKLTGDAAGDKNTSATYEATESSATYRFTVAFRTGTSPEPYRKIRPLSASPTPVAKPSVAPLIKKNNKPKKITTNP